MSRWMLAAVLLLGGCTAKTDVERGKRLATITGCISCHGAKLDGHLFEEDPQFALVWSSNLSRLLPRYRDADIARTLRSGRRPDGSAIWFMPTFAHRALDDADMRDLAAWLRSVPATGKDHPPIAWGPQAAAAKAQGFADSAAEADRLARRLPVDLGSATAKGRYLSRIACAQCHGPDLHGARNPGPGQPPDLDVTAAYSAGQLATLFRTGLALGGRTVGEMSSYGRERLAVLTDDEVAAIHAYLTARARAARSPSASAPPPARSPPSPTG